jgi:predicted metalloprotease with PDZ domain
MIIAATMLSAAGAGEAQNPAVRYQLGMSQPHTHLFEVEITIEGLNKNEKTIDFIMPVWRSGRYVIFDFAGGVQEFSAEANGAALQWRKIDKSTWRVENNGSAKVAVRYKVFANEFELRTRGLNDRHGFVDGSAVFMYVEKFRRLPLTLQVIPFGNWHVTTGLDAVAGQPNLFRAPNYDYLADCPLEIGTHQDFDFEAEGKPHRLMIFGEGNWEAPRLIEDLQKIVKTCKEFWGELPYQHYTFMLHCTPSSGGGTEHINSTIMGTRPYIFREPATYRGFIGLSMHEFFHTWNVKQLRPAGIHPYDFTKENYTEELWLAEGGTDYYTMILTRRADFNSVERTLEALATMIRNAYARPGRRVQSLAESSFDAWIKLWKGSPNAFNAEVDYYGKGKEFSLLLDLEIRQRSENRASLDDAMRALYKRFPLGKKGLRPQGYTNADVQKIAEELTGSSFKEFFANYLYGKKEFDFAKSLAYAGLEVTERKRDDAAPDLGLVTAQTGERTVVQRVIAGSAAYAAGLDYNDELLALNGNRVRSSDLNERLKDYQPGDKVTLTVFRDEQLRHFEVTLQAPAPAYQVQRVKEPTALQKKIYSSWLNAEWPEEKTESRKAK